MDSPCGILFTLRCRQQYREQGDSLAGGYNAVTGIDLHHSKQLLPASAWAKRRQPGPNSRWVTTAPSWNRNQIVTLDGKDTPHVGHLAGGGAASNGGGSGGGVAVPSKPDNMVLKASVVRAKTR